MYQRVKNIILLTLIISTICVNLRLVGMRIMYLPDELSHGYPRLVELCAIIFIIMGLFKKDSYNFKWNVILYTILFSLIVAFKPYFFPYLRTSVIIPGLLLASTMTYTMKPKNVDMVLLVLYIVITIGSFFVLLSTKVDLGVKIYWADSTTQRYVGFGQSLPYQACYSLYAIPLFVYFIKNRYFEYQAYINILMLMINVVAIIMTGARTSYIILIIMGLYYLKNIKGKYMKKYFWPLLLISLWFIYEHHDMITNMWIARNDENIATGTGRFEVWYYAILINLSNPLFGIDNYWESVREYSKNVPHVQNGYLELMFMGGIPLFGYVVYIIRKMYNEISKDTSYSSIINGIMIIFLIFMMSEIIQYSSQAFYPFIIIFGLLFANSNNTKVHLK